ncbi:glycosyltransferase family 2 protein [Nitrosovibrio tenuis]|uniref:Glycosyltransferase, GT2 family n=1 Tax=Nitrosovibrio tenuis TaxID=1233 RepID=A0A1H7FL45_9PROT|nr:glycosyltransferase family A protein [Nitrosovibrio tenuis]SEK26524.1 Glycosyltransferase, GT2 family [Nitrosovibrio tenuis]
MKLSLILATVDRSADVGRFIRSLIAQTDRNFELLVVDQNTDGRLLPYTKEGREGGLELHHLRLSPPSLSGARNLGITKSTGELIGFPDDDCWYDPDTVAQILHAFSAKPELQGIVACWEEQMRGQEIKPQTGSLSLEAWRNFRGGDASSISLFFRRELFNQLGGFDERFGVGQWYGAAEETDFILRALASRAQLDHCPTARVHHLFSSSVHSTLPHHCLNARRRSRGTGGIYGKHDLPSWVILRGFFAPIYHAILRPEALRLGFSISLGRIEGYLRWKFREQ